MPTFFNALASTLVATLCLSGAGFIPTAAQAEPATSGVDADVTSGAAAALAGYDALLRAHVDDLGFVDYDALHADPAALTAYVESLADPDLLDNHTPDATLATLINAYNAFTLQLILDHYDKFQASGGGAVTSITDLHGGQPWDQEIWTLAGQTLSLNQLEHDLIRRDLLTVDGVPGAAEPRLHWAVVCAAYSCPPLRAEAYTAQNLEAQLADQEHRVLHQNDPRFIDTSNHRLTAVTQLFNWYGSDFRPDWKTYLTQHLHLPLADEITFIDYNWQLNSTANRPPRK